VGWQAASKGEDVKKRTTVYLHSDKDSMYETGVKIGLTGEALSMFSHALCEVRFEIEVDETGLTTIVGLEGTKISLDCDSPNK
jgi:hypothetical protein